MRSAIQFSTENQLILRGWLYTPTATYFPVPCIIMTHGFSALKEHYLDQFAARFAKAGMFVLIYDNRNFGASDKEVPYEIDPKQQIIDLKNAISFAQTLKNVDRTKIGLWGTSFSGGIVLETTAMDKRVGCVVAQVPFVSGHHEYLRKSNPEQWQIISKQYQHDYDARARGLPPAFLAVVTKDPNQTAIMKQEEAYDFFTSIEKWDNKVTLRSLQHAGEFYPIKNIEKIAPIPMLFIVADNDTVNPTRLAVKAFEKAGEPKKLVMVPGHHFVPYAEQFEICVSEATQWFQKYLR